MYIFKNVVDKSFDLYILYGASAVFYIQTVTLWFHPRLYIYSYMHV